jgi:DNA-binding IclR family transcriptional regulator
MLVRQAANVLDLLQLFASAKRPLALAEIAHQLEWPRSSTFNLLGTLVARGFLYEPTARGGFYPTPRWLSIAQQIAQAEPVPQAVSALLGEVAQATAETAVLAASAGENAVFLEVVESPHAIRYSAHVGKLVPIHATATGRCLLSMFPEQQRRSLLNKISYQRFTPATLMTASAVEADIRKSVARGWFESAGGFTRDLGGAAVPLQVDGRRFAILVAGPTFRTGKRYQEFANTIRKLADRHLGAGREVEGEQARSRPAGEPAAKPVKPTSAWRRRQPHG